MGSDSGDVFAELKNISKKEVFAVGIGGLLIGSTVTHGEVVSALSAVIMRAVETIFTIYRDNISVLPGYRQADNRQCKPGHYYNIPEKSS